MTELEAFEVLSVILERTVNTAEISEKSGTEISAVFCLQYDE